MSEDSKVKLTKTIKFSTDDICIARLYSTIKIVILNGVRTNRLQRTNKVRININHTTSKSGLTAIDTIARYVINEINNTNSIDIKGISLYHNFKIGCYNLLSIKINENIIHYAMETDKPTNHTASCN